jgi:uncharacterized protein YvpB
MRRILTQSVAVLAALATLTAFGMTPATASENVTAWVETGSSTPGVGCQVSVSVEVRSGGGAVSGAEIAVSLVQDGTNNIISIDRATTNGSGIARLTMDTTPGWDGLKGWMEVAVNGSYIGGQTIRLSDGGCSVNGTLVTMSGTATTTLRGGTSSPQGSSSKVTIPNVWTYQQQRGLSCEYAALSIATGALGGWVDEHRFDSVVPLNANPHWGYRGNIRGSWGNTTDYGVYAAPLVPALERFGFTGKAFYGNRADLIAAIDRGEPTLVWLGLGGDLSHSEYTADGTRYQLTKYMHVMVAYGYDSSGVYLSDPGTGSYKYYSWGDFLWMWNVMDGMALSVSR